MRSTHMRILCPHCDNELRVGVSLEGTERTRKGPTPEDLGPEVDEFVISAIDNYRLSFSAVAKLLEEREILTPKKSKRWFPASVSRLYYAALDRRVESQSKTGE